MQLHFGYDFRSRPYERYRQPLELELFRVHLIFLFYSFFFSSLSDMSALHILLISNAPKYVFATVVWACSFYFKNYMLHSQVKGYKYISFLVVSIFLHSVKLE